MIFKIKQIQIKAIVVSSILPDVLTLKIPSKTNHIVSMIHIIFTIEFANKIGIKQLNYETYYICHRIDK